MKDTAITNKVFLKALAVSSPIFFAYFTMAMVFGLVLENEGYYWLLGPIMGLLVYAGAVQFLALSLIDQGSPIIEILIACFFVGARNSFYGPAFFHRFSNFSFWSRTYLAFSLVDATYGLLIKKSPVSEHDDERYCLYVSILVHAYWVVGALFGAFAGKYIPPIQGLDFVMTILFTLLALDQYYKIRKLWPFMVGVLGWVIMLFINPHYAFLGGIAISLIIFTIVLKRT